MRKKTVGIILGGLLTAFIALVAYGMIVPTAFSPHMQPRVAPTQVPTNTVSYKGVSGKDALTLLKSQTNVVQDKSGLVTTIGTRKADNTKKEFWAFYVNGKEAQVGPAAYQTKNGDKIEWKIETY